MSAIAGVTPFPRISLGTLLCIGFALFYSLFNWLPLVDAEWSVIDDHEIVHLIGQRDRLPLLEIPSALGTTEVADARRTMRFRPSYFSVRFLEAAAWGKHPQIWYSARIAIAVLFALALTLVCLNVGGPFLTFGFLVFEFSRSYWSDIFARLGPAETYAAFALSLIALGMIAGTKKGWNAFSAGAVAIGIIIAAGSKENFLLLGALPIWLIFSRSAKLSPGLKAMFLVVLAYLVWIVVTIISAVLSSGHDVYANPTSIGSRLGLFSSLLTRIDVLGWLAICTLLLVSVRALKRGDEQMKLLSKSLQGYLVGIFFMLVAFAAQYVFYFGKWPEAAAAPRYLFPGILCMHLSIFLCFVALAKVIRSLPAGSKQLGIVSFFGAVFLLGIAIKLSTMSFNPLNVALAQLKFNREASKLNVNTTVLFTKRLDEALNFLKRNPSAVLIINSHHIWDYEPAFSIQRFVKSSGIDNRAALRLDGYSSASFPQESLAFQLAEGLERVHADGGHDFVPWHTLDLTDKCFSFGMHGPPYGRCEAGNVIYP
jgi:hypothetical protein